MLITYFCIKDIEKPLKEYDSFLRGNIANRKATYAPNADRKPPNNSE